jgi:putative flippase GtrA
MSNASRPFLFVGVGAIGLATQLAVLSGLTAAGLAVPAATALAVAAAVVHNFLWHRRFTWGDRPQAAILPQLLRFSGLNGLVSLTGNVVVTSALTSAGVPLVVANLAAVVLCAAANFLLADRLVFALAALAVSVPSAEAAVLTPATVVAWNEYVRQTEVRIGPAEAKKTNASSLTADEWRRLRDGEPVMFSRETRRPEGTSIDVPDGALHHWVGRVFLTGVTLDAVLAELQAPTTRRWVPAEVASMRVVPDRRGGLRVLMRLTRSNIVDVTYDTEHAVTYVRHAPDHATSRSVSRRIQQVVRPGRPGERLMPEGNDHGFLWRLNAYWRYTAVDGGVLVECESLALSRGVPAFLRAVASPAIARVSRESLAGTLGALLAGFSRRELTAR